MTAKVKLTAKTYRGNADNGVIPVTVIATGVASFPYTVEIRPLVASLGSLHVAQPGHDFVNETKFVTFRPKQSTSLQKVVNITIIPDKSGSGHNTEVFKVKLFLSSDIECSGIDEGSPIEAFIIFTDE